MCASVSLEVECVVEALAAESAEVPLDVAVALHVPVEQSLQGERFGADSAAELAGRVVRAGGLAVLLLDAAECGGGG